MDDSDIFKFMTDPEAQEDGDQYGLNCWPTAWQISLHPTAHTLDAGETE